MLRIDHAIVAVQDLEAAMNDFRAVGFTVSYGGVHASGATHNALMVFRDGTYLELMALTGQPALPDTADYSFLFAHGEGVVGLCLASDDLPAKIEAIRARGGSVDDPADGGRARPDGTEMRWRTAWVDGQPLPFIIEDLTPRVLRVTDDPAALHHENGAAGLVGINIQAASEALLGRFDAVFGASVGFGIGWAEYQCGEARVRLEFGGTRDTVTGLRLEGIRTTIHSHGALITGA